MSIKFARYLFYYKPVSIFIACAISVKTRWTPGLVFFLRAKKCRTCTAYSGQFYTSQVLSISFEMSDFEKRSSQYTSGQEMKLNMPQKMKNWTWKNFFFVVTIIICKLKNIFSFFFIFNKENRLPLKTKKKKKYYYKERYLLIVH